MRTVAQLLDPDGTGQRLLDEWIATATNSPKVFRSTTADGEACLEAIQVTTRSPMGALAHGYCGITVDHGWVRVLGAGGDLKRSLASWNRLSDGAERLPRGFLIGDDVLGGFFAINGGRFDGPPGAVFYFAPDMLRWEPFEATYSDWLQWVLRGDLDEFYRELRWATWEEEVEALRGDHALLVYPFPSAEGPAFEHRKRSAVPVDQLWTLYALHLSQL